MADKNDLKWTISATGTWDEIRALMEAGGSKGALASPASVLASGAPEAISMLAGGSKVLRSKDSLSEVHVLQPTTNALDLLQAVRAYWTALRDRQLADANPVKIYVSAEDGTVVFAFRWKNAGSKAVAERDPEVARSWGAVRGLGVEKVALTTANEVYQGFEYKQFPKVGGVELLKGKCTCTVKLDAFDEPFELDGQNGFVIMHRGPRLSQADSHLMPVNILAHGADSPSTRAMIERGFTQPIRVEQNTELPQFGIIRSLKSPLAGPETADFPATAMWVVHWRIHTPVGTVITDPNVPLVFGPTTVQHYPPVGTQFASSTGPVDIMLADTGEVVGKLTPGELTAFDIVVTMDDEIPSVMDMPTEYYVKMFNRVVNDPNQKIETGGLANDFRVPLNVLANFDRQE